MYQKPYCEGAIARLGKSGAGRIELYAIGLLCPYKSSTFNIPYFACSIEVPSGF